LAAALGLRSAVFDLSEPAVIGQHLQNVALVVNLAGPFSRTQSPLIEACLATKTHYIDIAGEVDEMRSAWSYDAAARDHGIMIMPGAGFGVVPTDIVANAAMRLLPGATSLKIAYVTRGGVSRGTLHTVLKDINSIGVQRVDGALVPAVPAHSAMNFAVAGKRFRAFYNPWRADLFTAGLSTGVRDIATYSQFPKPIVAMMHGRLLWLRDLVLDRVLRHLPEGPSERQLKRGRTYVQAVASDGKAQATASLVGPEAYLFTARCVTEIVREVRDGKWLAGFQTPAYYGPALLDRIAGVDWV
jgi:short subunit dehydrogenase-like uncharacterized protein